VTTKRPIPSPAPPTSKRKSKRSTASAKPTDFGKVVRNRRRERNLTQGEVASRIRTSIPYVGQLESGKRHPSDQVVTRLAKVLGLDRRELFLLANPQIEALLATQPETAEGSISVWEQFRNDKQLQLKHNVSTAEVEMLSRLEGCNFARIVSTHDLIYILNAMRHAVRK
jgi:transcriptional regulator with XRE-family HTH domain